MRTAFILFGCLLVAGVCVNIVAEDSTPENSLEFQEDTAPDRANRPAFPDRPWREMGENERSRWRRRRFWDTFEPSHTVKFSTPELYVERYASRNIIDPKISVFEVQAEAVGEKGVRLTGKVLWPEYADGLRETFETLGFDPVESTVEVLPSERLGGRLFGLSTTHTLEIRRDPDPKGEQMNQAALGDGLRLLEESQDGTWTRVIASDGYVGWAPSEHIRKIDKNTWEDWQTSPRWARLLQPIRLVKEGREFAVLPAASSLPVREVKEIEVGEIVGIVAEIRKRGETGTPRDDYSEAIPGGGQRVQSVRLPFEPPNNWAGVPMESTRVFTPNGEAMKNDILRVSKPLLGVPYVWGGISERGVDCSGFTQYVYRIFGTALSRDADEQSIGGRLIFRRGETLDVLHPGDLLFFINGTGRVSHVALSLGGTEYVHASGGRVSLGSLDPDSPNFSESYLKKLAFAKRYLFGNYE